MSKTFTTIVFEGDVPASRKFSCTDLLTQSVSFYHAINRLSALEEFVTSIANEDYGDCINSIVDDASSILSAINSGEIDADE